VRVIARSTLTEFIRTREGRKDHSAVKKAVEAWFAEAKAAAWKNMADVKALYASASVVTSDRVVCNLQGNHYRLVAAVDFKRHVVFVKWIGAHAEYDEIDVKMVQHDR
jgi:mRNA interferase HigB